MSWSSLELPRGGKSYILLLNCYLSQPPYKFIHLGMWLGEHGLAHIIDMDDILEKQEKHNSRQEYVHNCAPIMIRLGYISDPKLIDVLDDYLTETLDMPHAIFVGPMMRNWLKEDPSDPV